MDILKRFRKYMIVTILGAIFTIFVCWMKGFSINMEQSRMYKLLSDATFFTAVLLIGFGLMISISNFGLFTAVSYSMKKFFAIFSKEMKSKDMPSYYEYRMLRLEDTVSGAFIYIPGILFLVISILFIVVLY